MEEKIDEILESINLSKNERAVYIDLIKHPGSSVLDIAKKTKIHRTNVYDAIRKLKERGFAAEILQDDKKLFVAGSPQRITRYLEQLKQDFQSIIPHLNFVANDKKEKETVTLNHGIFALREVLLELLELNLPINVFGAPKEAIDYFGPAFLEDFHRKRIKKKILMRHIYNQDAIERIKELNKMPYTEAKYLSKKYNSPITTLLCGNRIVLVTFINPPSIISIKNEQIAESHNRYFELLWRDARS
jgi:sugar-specific transcriptional regulator TrmB